MITDLPDAPDPGQAAQPMLADQAASVSGPKDAPAVTRGDPAPNVPVDADGNPIPLERRQPQRILGFMPNFRSVSGGEKPHPPGWKYNFVIATHQAVDYSSFIFLGLTSLSAKGIDEHPDSTGVRRGWSLGLHVARLPRQDRRNLYRRVVPAQPHPRRHALLRDGQRA